MDEETGLTAFRCAIGAITCFFLTLLSFRFVSDLLGLVSGIVIMPLIIGYLVLMLLGFTLGLVARSTKRGLGGMVVSGLALVLGILTIIWQYQTNTL